MAQKSIGQFIAALRRANGFTQQDVADRLNVSNKAVSRWERDECAPDIMLIPALAEMFSVTCDEILKGERILTSDTEPKKSEPRVEKQLKALITSTLTSFKTMILVALAFAVAGFISMLGMTYSFYSPPMAGFYVMLLFEVAAFTTALVATVRLRDKKADNELLINMDGSLLRKFNRTLGLLSYIAFFAVLCAVALSLPLVLDKGPEHYNSLLHFDVYMNYAFYVITGLMLAALFTKNPYIAFMTGQKTEPIFHPQPSPIKKMDFLQLGSIIIAAIILITAQFFDRTFYPDGDNTLHDIMVFAGLAIMLISVAVFIVFAVKYRKLGMPIILAGIRNMCLMLPVIMLAQSYQSGIREVFDEDPNDSYMSYFSGWNYFLMLGALQVSILATVPFTFIINAVSKRKAQKEKSESYDE